MDPVVTIPRRAPQPLADTLQGTLAALAAMAIGGCMAPAHAQRNMAAGEVTTSPVELTRTYLGSDGSVLSMRAVGTTVVGFSQDATGARAYVFHGSRAGSTISGQYYAVPKGGNTGQGSLVFTLSNCGANLARTGGENVGASTWVSQPVANMVFPKAREAYFQSIQANDLDGAFRGNDGSRAYVRQYGSTVAFLAEKFNLPTDARPSWATVFIGQREGDALSGQYYDLPYQTGTLAHGAFDAPKLATERTFSPSLWQGVLGAMPLRAMTYRADYAVDTAKLAQEIRNRMNGFTVGYSFAIAQDGVVVVDGADGDRRTPTQANGLGAGWPFTTQTLNEMSSTSKTVTLVAVLRALRDRGISVDSPVAPYLPATWPRHASMNAVTFRQLLAHGGLLRPAACNTDGKLPCLRDAVAGGMTATPGVYNNIHYAIFRVILPFVLDHGGMTALFASAHNDAYKNAVYSQAFRDYVKWVLQQGGVSADFEYVLSPGETIAYRYSWGPPAGNEYLNDTSADDYLEAGAGGLKMKTNEFAKFLSKLEQGAVLAPVDLATAKAIGFGGTAPFPGPAGVGPVATKNGGSGYAQSQIMVFPGTEVVITQNSTGNASQMDGDDLLMAAWQAALVGL